MAKMFYSLEEAAQKLGKSQDEVREMAQRNEFDEHFDGDRPIYKVSQIDLLSGDDGGGDDASGMSSMIPLSDSAAGGSNFGLDDSTDDLGLGGSSPLSMDDDDQGQVTMPDDSGGITVLDDNEMTADSSADTLITNEPGLDNVSLESFGSGSGLMDLTRESDDTSLGAENLLDEFYAQPEGGGQTETATAEGADMFEGSEPVDDSDVGGGSSPAGAAVAYEPYDGKGSGLAGGMALGMTLALLGGLGVVIMAMVGPVPGFLSSLNVADMGLVIPVAALLGLTLIFGALGFVLGGRK